MLETEVLAVAGSVVAVTILRTVVAIVVASSFFGIQIVLAVVHVSLEDSMQMTTTSLPCKAETAKTVPLIPVPPILPPFSVLSNSSEVKSTKSFSIYCFLFNISTYAITFQNVQ